MGAQLKVLYRRIFYKFQSKSFLSLKVDMRM